MNLEQIKCIANSILYEGYILYPYRATAIKNQQRFNFGIVAPPASGESTQMRTECLIEGDLPIIDVHVRCLHLLSQEVSRLTESLEGNTHHCYEPVASLQIDSEMLFTWQETVERTIEVGSQCVKELADKPHQIEFTFESNLDQKVIHDNKNNLRGRVKRRMEEVQGRVTIEAESMRNGLWKVGVEISNTTELPIHFANQCDVLESSLRTNDWSRSFRDEGLLRSLVSTHTIVGAQSGRFISLLDPIETCVAFAGKCNNTGTWPVLVGDNGQQDMLLSSPIILYDYPQIAPESSGDFYDGLEIDEMLTLRVMTMTEEEKREMRSVDSRSRQILERIEAFLPDELHKLHGIIRELRPLKNP